MCEDFEWRDVRDEFEVDWADSPPDVRGEAEGEAGQRGGEGGWLLGWGWWCHGVGCWVGGAMVCGLVWWIVGWRWKEVDGAGVGGRGGGAMLGGDAN